jgi:hypothetical protein
MRRDEGTVPMIRKFTPRLRRVALPAAALLLTLGLFQACGSSSGGAFGAGGSDSADAGGSLNLPGSGATAGTLDVTGTAGVGTASGGATAATGGGSAAGGACVGANCGVPVTGPAKAAGATCTMPDQCQSGRCEPVTGMPTEACLSACFADGVACTAALDCCSTGCMNGKCGGQCTVVGDPCKVNAECCSNVCQAGQCQVDMPNRDCRPTGEDCGKGSGSGCCNTCNKDGRCDFGPDTCFAQGVACTATAQCCHGECLSGVCTTPCVAQAGACTANADCCSVSCVAGKCQPPPPATGVGGASGTGGSTGVGGAPTACVLTGDSCTTAGQCCSGVCFGGFCEAPVR